MVVECAFTALLLMSTMVVPVPAALHCIASLAFMMVFCFSSFFLFSRRSQAHPHFVSPRFDPDISFGIKHYAGQMSSTALCILSVGLPACLRMRGDPVAMICKCLHYTQLPACSPCTFTLTCRGVSCLVLSCRGLSYLVSSRLGFFHVFPFCLPPGDVFYSVAKFNQKNRENLTADMKDLVANSTNALVLDVSAAVSVSSIDRIHNTIRQCKFSVSSRGEIWVGAT